MTTKTSMHIDPYERTWMIVSAILLVGFLTAISVAGFAMGIQLPNPERRVDPQQFEVIHEWRNASVLIRGNQIAAVGPADELSEPWLHQAD